MGSPTDMSTSAKKKSSTPDAAKTPAAASATGEEGRHVDADGRCSGRSAAATNTWTSSQKSRPQPWRPPITAADRWGLPEPHASRPPARQA
ncbi:hypothetical protein I553_0291 [Mycobacterium xenopi 4042]|uniref:Uncharacterized protein n=1 Tax=Mycobacterium xenopi 4042 TaxID=1299334 RepID=X7YKQ3_MYCXE|nr:hypothetical protein I553_0291 [Mycobacterium xenopi 4042]